MSHDSGGRPLLPQDQMASFPFQQQTYPPQRETQKNYVFVDEHNRHKRLKVMRACEGCRRRKIKCDAATTNTWPCSACIRLKLPCVRPNGQYDGSSPVYEPSAQGDPFRMANPARPQQQILPGQLKPDPSMYAPQDSYASASGAYPPVQYTDNTGLTQNLHYTTVPPSAGVMEPYTPQSVFPTPPLAQGSSQPESPPNAYSQDPYAQSDVADLLGSLKINEAGTAPYLNNKLRARHEEEEPAVEEADEYKSMLPPMASGPGLKIRIPPELMPDDDTILHYFDLYFTNVHPYVPVLDKATFYHQFQNNRESISPLILEAIFAISGRLADEPAQGQQWLALASKHADSFMDVPRISTLQALLIVLKARESAPKRGYYYRSWMSIVQCVQMAKDIGLDEHHDDHKSGRPCKFAPSECMMITRIWQTIFVCEIMIGSPQGRTDLSVEHDTVDLGVPRPYPGGDESEYHVSRNFTYFARLVAEIGRLNNVYARVKKNKSWGIDPEVVQLNPSLTAWMNELPPDLAISFPQDGSPPWLPTPFIGNLQSYYHLSVIMLHRPQLHFLEASGFDGQWKHHMMLCYSSAKFLCRLQEAVLNQFGLSALQCMQRGINFTIYAVLSCIVLHLVAITSPDPDLNSDAREHFTRHMRVLEKCMSAWPMPDMQRQIDSVREAFSADTRKPFVLKPSFPYGSPSSTTQSSPPRPGTEYKPPMLRTASLGEQLDPQNVPQSAHSYHGHPISPPISAGPGDGKGDSPAVQSLLMMAQGSQAPTMQHQSMPLSEAPTWNPSRIFDQWNTTFGTPEVQTQHSADHPQTNSLNVSPSSGASEIPTMQDIQTVHASLPATATSHMPPQQYSAAPVQTFVTPAMWQESVASVYEGGLKRAWDYESSGMIKRSR